MKIKKPYKVIYSDGWWEVIGPNFQILSTENGGEQAADDMNAAYAQGFKDAAEHYGHGYALRADRKRKERKLR